MYSEGINTKLHLDYKSKCSLHLEIDHFFIMVIYTGFPYVLYFHGTVKVSIRNYTWTIRASVHLEIDLDKNDLFQDLYLVL